jgi:hypothetical protein
MDGPRCPHHLLIPDDHSRGRDVQEDAGVEGGAAMHLINISTLFTTTYITRNNSLGYVDIS